MLGLGRLSAKADFRNHVARVHARAATSQTFGGPLLQGGEKVQERGLDFRSLISMLLRRALPPSRAAAIVAAFYTPCRGGAGRLGGVPSLRLLGMQATKCAVAPKNQKLVQDILRFGLMDPELHALARKKLESHSQMESRTTWALIAGAGLAAAMGPLVVLNCLGFKGSMIAAGSWAAASQPAAIASGSWFAWAQSTAATGGLFTKLGLVTSTSTWVALSRLTKPADMTDKELLETLVQKELIDDEVRNLLLKKLRPTRL